MKNLLIEKLKKNLPGEKAHSLFYPQRKNSKNQYQGEKRISAVAIHIYIENEKFYFILIRKSKYDGHHSGQIAFPGGKKEAQDISTIYTARRETFEELNIPMHQGEYIRSLTTVHIPVSNFIVDAHIFLHDSKLIMTKNYEVDEIFSIELTELLNENNIGTITVDNLGLSNVPAFLFNKCEVWGATALFLSELKEMLK